MAVKDLGQDRHALPPSIVARQHSQASEEGEDSGTSPTSANGGRTILMREPRMSVCPEDPDPHNLSKRAGRISIHSVDSVSTGLGEVIQVESQGVDADDDEDEHAARDDEMKALVPHWIKFSRGRSGPSNQKYRDEWHREIKHVRDKGETFVKERKYAQLPEDEERDWAFQTGEHWEADIARFRREQELNMVSGSRRRQSQGLSLSGPAKRIKRSLSSLSSSVSSFSESIRGLFRKDSKDAESTQPQLPRIGILEDCYMGGEEGLDRSSPHHSPTGVYWFGEAAESPGDVAPGLAATVPARGLSPLYGSPVPSQAAIDELSSSLTLAVLRASAAQAFDENEISCQYEAGHSEVSHRSSDAWEASQNLRDMVMERKEDSNKTFESRSTMEEMTESASVATWPQNRMSDQDSLSSGPSVPGDDLLGVEMVAPLDYIDTVIKATGGVLC